MSRKTRYWICLLLTLAIAIAAGGAVAADSPMMLENDKQVGGELMGAIGGSYALYEIDYAGGEAEIDVEMWYAPANPVTKMAVGFNVYGWHGFEGKGEPNADGDVGVLEFTYSDSEPTKLLIQVYNYLDGQAVGFGLTASGLPMPAATVEVVEPVAAAAPVFDGNAAISATSVGDPGGDITLHRFMYPGDEEDITFTLQFWPTDPAYCKAVGMLIYGPTGHLVATGEPCEEPGQRNATFSSDIAGEYTVQVFNYADDITISYTLTPSR